MSKDELIKVLENGLAAVREADNELALARCLNILGGICKFEREQIERKFQARIDAKLGIDSSAD